MRWRRRLGWWLLIFAVMLPLLVALTCGKGRASCGAEWGAESNLCTRQGAITVEVARP